MKYWSFFNDQNGNKIGKIVHNLTVKQTEVCGVISEMKATWLEVANNGTFSTEMEDKLKNEEEQLLILQEEVDVFLKPYEDAKGFLSWTLTQMTQVKEEKGRVIVS